MSAKSNLAKLPERCYLVNPLDGTFCTDAPVICLVAGESGFYPIHPTLGNSPEYLAECVARWNEKYSVQSWHIEAMQIGSCFGWEVPGADADYWQAQAQGVQS